MLMVLNQANSIKSGCQNGGINGEPFCCFVEGEVSAEETEEKKVEKLLSVDFEGSLVEKYFPGHVEVDTKSGIANLSSRFWAPVRFLSVACCCTMRAFTSTNSNTSAGSVPLVSSRNSSIHSYIYHHTPIHPHRLCI